MFELLVSHSGIVVYVHQLGVGHHPINQKARAPRGDFGSRRLGRRRRSSPLLRTRRRSSVMRADIAALTPTQRHQLTHSHHIIPNLEPRPGDALPQRFRRCRRCRVTESPAVQPSAAHGAQTMVEARPNGRAPRRSSATSPCHATLALTLALRRPLRCTCTTTLPQHPFGLLRAVRAP